MDETVRKALHCADLVLKGGASTLPADAKAFEDVLLAYSKSKCLPGESEAACFTRLYHSGDDVVRKLWAASDQARLNSLHRDAIVAVRKSASLAVDTYQQAIDELVRKSRRPKESEVAATARLWDESPEFRNLVKRQSDAQSNL